MGSYDDLEQDCYHEEYEQDVLTGRATCTMCGHRWIMTLDDIRRHEALQAAYDKDCEALDDCAVTDSCGCVEGEPAPSSGGEVTKP